MKKMLKKLIFLVNYYIKSDRVLNDTLLDIK